MAWKDGFVIEYTSVQDAPHSARRSCRNCIHYQGEKKCGVMGYLHPDVGFKSWRWCGRFAEDKAKIAERAERKRLAEKKGGKKKSKKKKPPPNKFIRKGIGPLGKKKDKPSGKRCKAEGCSRLADAGAFCKYHNGKV